MPRLDDSRINEQAAVIAAGLLLLLLYEAIRYLFS